MRNSLSGPRVKPPWKPSGRPLVTPAMPPAKLASEKANRKLCDDLLAFAVARRWERRQIQRAEPGWVATKMDGPSAPDDLHQGCLTQAWLATSEGRVGAIERRRYPSLTSLFSEPDRGRRAEPGSV